MALIASTPNTKLNQSSIYLLSDNKPQIKTTLFFKFKPPKSNYSISKSLTLTTFTPICKYGDSSNTHNDGRSKRTRLSAVSNTHNDGRSNRIWWSDVAVKNSTNVLVEGKWDSISIGNLSAVVGMHGNLAHKSFKLPKWLEYLFAYCGVLALQGNPIDWVSTHRYHHQFCDSEQDPHSPLEGFWFSHMNWMFDGNIVTERCGVQDNVGDLEKQPFYRFMRSSYILHPLMLAGLLYAFGGFPYLVWGMGVRTAWVYHITWFVNSASHVWGTQDWNTGDLSRNNWWVALLSFGEGWHNNHHAFEYSARHGLEWWQFDMTWYTIKFLQLIGLAKDVKLPTEAHKQRMAINNDGIPT